MLWFAQDKLPDSLLWLFRDGVICMWPRASIYIYICIYDIDIDINMYVCASVTKMVLLWVLWFTFICLVFACTVCWSNESYLRTFLYDTKPAKSLRRTFLRSNSQTRNRSDNKMAAPETSVHLGQNGLSYAFAIYLMTERFSQICSIRIMLRTSKTLLASYSSNVAEVEPTAFCEGHHIGSNTHTVMSLLTTWGRGVDCDVRETTDTNRGQQSSP